MLEGNTIHQNGVHEIYVNQSGGMQVVDNEVWGNTNTSRYAMFVQGAAEVLNNRVHDNAGGGIQVGQYGTGTVW